MDSFAVRLVAVADRLGNQPQGSHQRRPAATFRSYFESQLLQSEYLILYK